MHDVEQILWNAFWLLNTDRPSGMSVSYIPYTSISTYHEKECGFLDRQLFFSVIREMDACYLSYSNSGESDKTFTRDMLRG